MSLAALGHPPAPWARGQGANCSPVTPGCGVLPSAFAGSSAGRACSWDKGTLVAASAPRPCVRTCNPDAGAEASAGVGGTYPALPCLSAAMRRCRPFSQMPPESPLRILRVSQIQKQKPRDGTERGRGQSGAVDGAGPGRSGAGVGAGPGPSGAGPERGRVGAGPGSTGMLVAVAMSVITILRPSLTFRPMNYSSPRYTRKRHRYLSIIVNKK